MLIKNSQTIDHNLWRLHDHNVIAARRGHISHIQVGVSLQNGNDAFLTEVSEGNKLTP